MLPVGVLMAFGAMKLLGIGSNIMSLGGVAIAIGAMVDAAIVMIENAHKHLERGEPGRSRIAILMDASSEVGPALFFSLLVTPFRLSIFTLKSQEGRFQPARLHQDVLDGGGRLVVGDAGTGAHDDLRSRPDHSRAQEPNQSVLDLDLSAGDQAGIARQDAGGLARDSDTRRYDLAGKAAWHRIHAESNEGTLLYMPTTLPGVSVTKAAD